MKKATRSVHFLIYKEGLLGLSKSCLPSAIKKEHKVFPHNYIRLQNNSVWYAYTTRNKTNGYICRGVGYISFRRPAWKCLKL